MQYESFIDVGNYCLGATLGQVEKGWGVSLFTQRNLGPGGEDK